MSLLSFEKDLAPSGGELFGSTIVNVGRCHKADSRVPVVEIVSFVAERTLAEGFCGTHGTGRENSRVCSRTARPPLLTGSVDEKRAQSLVLSMGWVGGEQEFIGEVG